MERGGVMKHTHIICLLPSNFQKICIPKDIKLSLSNRVQIIPQTPISVAFNLPLTSINQLYYVCNYISYTCSIHHV